MRGYIYEVYITWHYLCPRKTFPAARLAPDFMLLSALLQGPMQCTFTQWQGCFVYIGLYIWWNIPSTFITFHHCPKSNNKCKCNNSIYLPQNKTTKNSGEITLRSCAWASYQIPKMRVAHAPGTFCHRLPRKPIASDFGMHHGTWSRTCREACRYH